MLFVVPYFDGVSRVDRCNEYARAQEPGCYHRRGDKFKLDCLVLARFSKGQGVVHFPDIEEALVSNREQRCPVVWGVVKLANASLVPGV